ncbi:hypothetical protein P167DRAFT_34120 [Morchella conica CCBAS932]|uniref:Uncharacterized protein n=1 Tax=Morchella conica CCBAS932 TaxID=1392247 RepID=A0A3N4L0B5_9PEZI|nr:hypothetical protein P167DRAFT_34120 [Morchella conica CCBAS932]
MAFRNSFFQRQARIIRVGGGCEITYLKTRKDTGMIRLANIFGGVYVAFMAGNLFCFC